MLIQPPSLQCNVEEYSSLHHERYPELVILMIAQKIRSVANASYVISYPLSFSLSLSLAHTHAHALAYTRLQTELSLMKILV